MVGKKNILLFTAVLAAIFGFIFVYSDKGLVHLNELQRDMALLRADNAKLREENRRLLLQIERFKTDPRYIEDEARRKLGLIRPDETIYRLREEPEPSSSSDSTAPGP